MDENGCADIKLYVKLIDFDFVDYIDKDDHRRIGAVFYMSPQIANNTKYKNPDVFSLGMLWYKAITGYYMIDDPRSYSSIISQENVFNKTRDDSFTTFKWERIKDQPSIKMDRHYIKLMTAFNEENRPIPQDLIRRQYFDSGSHVIEDKNNDN